MERVDLMIRNAIIIPISRRTIFKGSICIMGDRIVAVGKDDDIMSRYRAERYIDARGKAALPGFVNAHMHECLMRGFCEDLPLMRWLEEVCFPKDRVFSREDMRAAALLNQLEMIKSGITTFIDIFRFQEEAAKVAMISGLRAVLSSQIIDIPFKIEDISSNENLVKNWNGKAGGRIITWFGAHSPYACTKETLLKVAELANKYNVGIHIHISETLDEVKLIMKRYGKRPVEYLNEIGFLSDRVHAAHCVHLSEKEMKILRDMNVSVAYNPTSNMKLASGIAPIPQLLKLGVTVGLGTDSILSNNNLDMFEEMRIGSFLQKLDKKDPSVLSCYEMLRMATLEGAKCLNLEHEIGSIDVGKKADLILVDLRKPHLHPIFIGDVSNIVENLVYSAYAADVDTTIVDGKILMENREVKTLNEEEVYELAQKRSLSLYKRMRTMVRGE